MVEIVRKSDPPFVVEGFVKFRPEDCARWAPDKRKFCGYTGKGLYIAFHRQKCGGLPIETYFGYLRLSL